MRPLGGLGVLLREHLGDERALRRGKEQQR
jgi:hypothetical protein